MQKGRACLVAESEREKKSNASAADEQGGDDYAALTQKAVKSTDNGYTERGTCSEDYVQCAPPRHAAKRRAPAMFRRQKP